MINMRILKSPILNPPCSGWKQDFPSPTAQPQKKPCTSLLNSNYCNNIYLEVSRHSLNMRWLLIPFIIPILVTFPIYIPGIILSSWNMGNLELFLGGIFCLACGVWSIACVTRYLISPPRDEPIRFNYARQKIYAYNFDMCWWNPFIPWPIKVVTYDWAQVRAERWRKQGTTLQGSHIVKVGIMLSIVEPGTNNVIDRFSLSNINDDESIWAYICTYMQHGSSAVPTPPPGPDHNNPPSYQLIQRLSQKVKWPTGIDLESRTAP